MDDARFDGVFFDPESSGLGEHFAVISVSGRRRRRRYPAGCVQVVASEAEARALASGDGNRVAAVVAGPSKSSENVEIYYPVRWLDRTQEAG